MAEGSLRFSRDGRRLGHTTTQVLLSDVDIVVTSNPFLALYRDTDVEGMSDGWDDHTAYGHVHSVSLSPGSSSGGGGGGDALTTLRLVARNSGLFYLAATQQCLRLTKILANRMATENVWDQSACTPHALEA